jgi:hypothetical protein
LVLRVRTRSKPKRFKDRGKAPDADAARTRAIAAYKVFLTLWKGPDVPILKEAKAEYAKLQ